MDSPSGSPDLIVVGAACRDVAADDPRGWRLGGAAVYAAVTAARLGLRVACVLGVDAVTLAAAELDILKGAGVELSLLLLAACPVFHNQETGGIRVQRWLSGGSPMPCTGIGAHWSAPRAWLLVPVAGEIGDDWADVPAPSAMVALGLQGWLRDFSADGTVRHGGHARSRVFQRADLVALSTEDMPPLASLASLRGLFRPDTQIVLTNGARGGLMFTKGGILQYGSLPAAKVLDPTGAGDVFLGGLVSASLASGTHRISRRSLLIAAAAATCSVEAAGVRGIPTLQSVRERIIGRGRGTFPGL